MIAAALVIALGGGLIGSILNLIVWLATGQPVFPPGDSPVSETVTSRIEE